MKERRLGRKIPEPLARESEDILYFESEDVDHDLGAGEKKSIKGDDQKIEEIRLISGEVTVRRKEESLPKRILPEKAQENKVREEALIHRIAENPKDVEAYRELGDYYMSIENIKDAKDSFKMVLKLRPRDLKAKSSLREIEMKMRLGS